MRILLVASTLCTVAIAAAAQDGFPLTGRWTFFDFGARGVLADEVADSCRNVWDSFSPDGAFISFSRNDMDEIAVNLAGFCELLPENGISCTYLVDTTGSIVETYADEIDWISDDIVDYVVRREDGKPDVESSWTYVRCPSEIRVFR